MGSDAILTVSNVHHAFGGVKAVNGCDFSVNLGSITGMIGPNGAGKSTLINVVMGEVPLQQGTVTFDGTDISGWPSYRIARRGLSRTFQISREFGGLTAFENLLVAAPIQPGEKLWNAILRPSVGRREDRRLVAKAAEVLKTFGIYNVRDEYARNLSGGQKRLVELGRAVMAEAKMVLLDEPLAGVNPALIDRLLEHLLKLRDDGMTFILAEHNLNVVERVCDRVIVIAEGRTLATGPMSELRRNDQVIRVYLGGRLDARAAS